MLLFMNIKACSQLFALVTIAYSLVEAQCTGNVEPEEILFQ